MKLEIIGSENDIMEAVRILFKAGHIIRVSIQVTPEGPVPDQSEPFRGGSPSCVGGE